MTAGYREPRRPAGAFLLRAKYILLTYSQVDEDVFRWQQVRNIIHEFGGRCRIGRELHSNGGVHFHAFCIKDARFVTRNARKFDVEGFHPNIERINGTPEKVWKYVAKDGNLVHDDIPEPPLGRSKQAKADNVWTTAYETAVNSEDFINQVLKGDTRRAACAFNGVFGTATWLYPKIPFSDYTPPSNLSYEFGGYPEIPAWKQRCFTECLSDDAETAVLPRTRDAADAVSGGQDSTVETSRTGSVGCSSPRAYSVSTGRAEGSTDQASEASETTGTSLGDLFGTDPELPRYAVPDSLPRLKLNTAQHRHKSLVIIGDTKLGKTLVSRSFGRHNYFQNEWNVENFNPDALYNVFDDMEKGLASFHWKAFLGCQHDITVTDKYHKKRPLKNGKPCIYLHNSDPLDSPIGRRNRKWLLGNCIFVYLTSPICNIARERLDEELLQDALMYIPEI